jgi:glycerol uptake facilitator protein
MKSPTIVQKFAAEVAGTAILVFIGAGSVPLTLKLTGNNPFGSAELSTISFAFAFAIIAAIYSVGHISGCHINPAVTIAALATRRWGVDVKTAGYYIVAQIIGALIGACLTFIILIGNQPDKLGLGAVGYTDATSGMGIAIAAEVIGTAVVGFIVFGIIILVGPITGAALNPARQIGPVIVGQLIGVDSATKWSQLVVYIVGPILGGLIGGFGYDLVSKQTEA